eukprot:Selendium_serpulae@DN3196_c0_g1_i1.p1
MTSAACQNGIVKLIARLHQLSLKRNAFEQRIFPHLSLLKVCNDGRRSDFTFRVEQDMCHYEGMMHTGMLASVISNSSAIHAQEMDPDHRVVATTQLNLNFLRPAMGGQQLLIRNELLLLGGHHVVADATVMDNSDNVVTKAVHSMLFVDESHAAHFSQHEQSDGLQYV